MRASHTFGSLGILLPISLGALVFAPLALEADRERLPRDQGSNSKLGGRHAAVFLPG
jgi:hypothetical protein